MTLCRITLSINTEQNDVEQNDSNLSETKQN